MGFAGRDGIDTVQVRFSKCHQSAITKLKRRFCLNTALSKKMFLFVLSRKITHLFYSIFDFGVVEVRF